MSVALSFAAFVGLSGLSGCLAAPEHCAGCLPLLSGDGGPRPDADGGGGSIAPVTGGNAGTVDAGLTASGGAGTGGAGSGGQGNGVTASGGTVGSSGGSGFSGGTPGAGTGGRGTGGAPGTGGAITAATGGRGTGGQGTGGVIGSGGQATGGTGSESDLVLWYKFDESSGTAALDSAPNATSGANGALMTYGSGGSASFSATKKVGTHSLSLAAAATSPNANGGYVVATTLKDLAPEALTIAVWVSLPVNGAAQRFERILDFGSGTGTAAGMYLTARAQDATNTPVRFAISTVGYGRPGEQRIDGSSPLSTTIWHHVAVVLPAGASYTGSLYVDGNLVGTTPNMTLHASDLGATTNNWIGRSQFSNTSNDSYFTGYIDDFRVYKRALSQPEIANLMTLR